MPAFDRGTQKIVVRIVYDGAAQAGKTTNLRVLASYFTERRRSDVLVPAEVDGRTLFFDFMHVDGGLVAGQPLRCQFVTVPGQRKLAGRRKQILQSADAVVFVCSSAARAQDRNCVMLDTLRWSLRAAGRGDVPLIVQANKQDLRTALTPEQMRVALRLGPEVPLVGATAHTGGGVRETSVLAIRAAARDVEQLLLERGVDEVLGRAESGPELLARLQQVHVDALTPAEMIEDLIETGVDEVEEHERPTQAGLEPITVTSEPATEPAAEAVVFTEPAAEAVVVTEPAAEAVVVTEPVAEAVVVTEPVAEAVVVTEPVADIAEGVQSKLPTEEPPRPNEDVPTGCVWPSTTGRQVLRALAGEAWRLRADLSGRRGVEDGSGAADVVIYEVGAYCAKTSSRRRFLNTDEAKAALLTLARLKIQLGEILPPATVLAAQQDSQACWLWTLAPWMPTLRATMNQAERAGDPKALAAALARFAAAAGRAVSLATQQGLTLDVHPSNFAAVGDGLYYLDDDIVHGGTLPLLGHALLQRVEEYAAHEAAVAAYLDAVEKELGSVVTAAELASSGVLEGLEQAHTRNPLAQAAQKRLLERFRAGGRRARAC